VTAKSTLEAESCGAAKAAPFLFGFSPTEKAIPPIPLLVDNLAALSTANHPKVTGQTTHIDLRYFRIRDYCGDDGEPARVRDLWVPTKLNVADFVSKILTTPLYFYV